MKLVIFGHVAIDYIFSVNTHPKNGESVPVHSWAKRLGGTGANIARAASRLGLKTHLASFVGDDFPQEFECVLRDDGVLLDALVKIRGERTPRCWIFIDENKISRVYIDQGAMMRWRMCKEHLSAVEAADIVHIGTGPPKYYLQIAKFGKELEKIVAFDPSQEISYMYDREDFVRITKYANIFFCNEREAKVAAKYLNLKSISDLSTVYETVIITRGSLGSVIMHGGKTYNIPSHAASVIDPTGAGDAYRAGFYAAYSRGMSISDCGKIGAIVASYVLGRVGGQENLPVWKEVYSDFLKFK